MITLRKDYLLDRWVIISEKRGKRPQEFAQAKAKPGSIDFFAPGNEHLTPPEIGRIEKKGKWQLRWFPNKFAAVSGDKYSKISGKLHKKMPAFGYHEVIVETRTKKQLWDLSRKELYEVLTVYKNRIKELSKKPHIKYVQIFKNQGKEAGTSLLHSHTQLIALPMIPQTIIEKKTAIRKTKINYQKILRAELKSKRKAIETREFGAICPFASRFSYELLIIPKKEFYTIEEMLDKTIKDLATMLHKALQKLRKNRWPYNFHLHYDPAKKDMLFHIEITPRLATWAGFEFGTSIIMNSTSPEKAAAFYRK